MNVSEDITIKTNVKQNYKKYIHSDKNFKFKKRDMI